MVKKFIIFTVALVFTFSLGFIGGRSRVRHTIGIQTDTCIIRDTIVDYRPILKEKWEIRTDTVWLPFVVTDTVAVAYADTVAVEVPIEMSYYKGEDYEIAVSGYRTEMEWVRVYPTTITVNKTRMQSRWSFGAVAGPSVLLTPSGRLYGGIGVSAGVTYRF
jgi:hypothetical protein